MANEELRDLVNRAVSNEVGAQVAPLREQVQISRGQLQQLNRDLGEQGKRIGDLETVVLGNPALKVKGLTAQVEEAVAAINGLKDSIDAWKDQFRGAKWALAALAAAVAYEPLRNVFTSLATILGGP